MGRRSFHIINIFGRLLLLSLLPSRHTIPNLRPFRNSHLDYYVDFPTMLPIPTLAQRAEDLDNALQADDNPSDDILCANLSPNRQSIKPWQWGRTRPPQSYTKHEWPENRGFSRWLRSQVKHCVAYQSSVHLDELVIGTNCAVPRTLDEADMLAPTLSELDSNVIFKVMSSDATPQPLVVFIPQGLSSVWHIQTRSDARVCWNTLNLRIQRALTQLNSCYVPDEMDEDKRRKDESVEKIQHKIPGVYHFAEWAQGHSFDTSNLIASAIFLQKIAPLVQGIGMIFEGVDNTAYRSYLKVFDHYLNIGHLDILQSSQRACFTCISVLRNCRAKPQQAPGDFQDGWAAICCFGEFEGGTLCLPGLGVESEGNGGGVQIQYQPGDVIFLRAAVLEYFVSGFEGERSDFVFFTKNA